MWVLAVPCFLHMSSKLRDASLFLMIVEGSNISRKGAYFMYALESDLTKVEFGRQILVKIPLKILRKSIPWESSSLMRIHRHDKA